MMEIQPSPIRHRRPPEDEEHDESVENLTHKRPPPPESSLSRIFYKSGPLGPTWRQVKRKDKIKEAWVTREMTLAGEDPEQKVIINLVELCFYFLFIILLNIMKGGHFPPSSFDLTRAMKREFIDSKFLNDDDIYINFDDISNAADVFKYLSSVLLDGLFSEVWVEDEEHRIAVDEHDRNILYENKLLGVARVHMNRVTRHSCKVHPEFVDRYKACYSFFNGDTEDRSVFIGQQNKRWSWRAEDGRNIEGNFGNYHRSGYSQDLTRNRSSSAAIIDLLFKNRWWTRSTRAIIVSFTIYNANLNLFCVVTLLFETPPTGGVFPLARFDTVKLLKYVTKYDYFVMGCELTFVMFVVYFIVEEGRELMFFGKSYFFLLWNWIDAIIVILCLLCIFLSITRTFGIKAQLETVLNSQGRWVNFDSLAYWQILFTQIVAVLDFLCMCKLFKYFTFTHSMDQLADTLSKCSVMIGNFTLIFFMVFWAFAQLGFLLFGTFLADYNTSFNACFTLIRVLVGDFNFNQLRDIDPVLGPMFFISYVLLIVFILMNTALAILNEAYLVVKREEEYDPNELTAAKYVTRAYYNIFHGCKRRVAVPRYKDRAKISYNDIYQLLKSRNFKDDEIEMFLCKFDFQKDTNVLGADDIDAVLYMLETRVFEAIVPPDVLIMAAEEREKIALKQMTMTFKAFRGLSLKDYHNLQARLDQIEIQLEVMAERFAEILHILEKAEANNWARRMYDPEEDNRPIWESRKPEDIKKRRYKEEGLYI